MAKLVVQPGTLTAWEIQLKAGTNSIGRAPTNDFRVGDASVSGAHCQLIVNDGTVTLKDLGSTNGTFVNRAPVREAILQPGQTLHLGGLEMLFCGGGPVPASPAPAAPAAPALPPPRAVGASTALRIGGSSTVALAGRPPGVGPARPAAVEEPPVTEEPPPTIGSGPCKHHPKIPGRYFCGHCQLFFCDACVTTRGSQKSCRHCGSECARVQVQVQRPTAPKGFFTRFPSAFIYPFRGSGLLVLLVSTVVLAALDYIAGSWFAILTKIVVFGYLFCFMQNIIHATANEEAQMPDLPGFDDVFGGAFRMAITVLICFTLPVVFVVLKFFDVMDVPASALIATMVLGCLYFPMAFLAVAMKDTALAANPLVVIPAIFKVPLGYLLTAMVVIGVFALRKFGDLATFVLGTQTYATRDMSVMFMTFGLRAVWCLVSVYLLTVSMRVLGLLYVTNRQKFGWFDR